MLRFILRRLLAGARPAVRHLHDRLRPALPRRRRHRPPHPRPDAPPRQHVADKAAELGLDRPLLAQYFDWLGNAIHGDFGASWFTGQPVTEAHRLPDRGHAVPGDRRDVAHRDRRGRARCLGRGPPRLGRPDRAGALGSRLRDPRLPHRAGSGRRLRHQPAAGSSRPATSPFTDSVRLAVHGHPADHRPGDRRHRRRRRSRSAAR